MTVPTVRVSVHQNQHASPRNDTAKWKDFVSFVSTRLDKGIGNESLVTPVSWHLFLSHYVFLPPKINISQRRDKGFFLYLFSVFSLILRGNVSYLKSKRLQMPLFSLNLACLVAGWELQSLYV